MERPKKTIIVICSIFLPVINSQVTTHYDFEDQREMAKYLVLAWILVFTAFLSLLCNYYTGCLTCECCKERLPTYHEIEH